MRLGDATVVPVVVSWLLATGLYTPFRGLMDRPLMEPHPPKDRIDLAILTSARRTARSSNS